MYASADATCRRLTCAMTATKEILFERAQTQPAPIPSANVTHDGQGRARCTNNMRVTIPGERGGGLEGHRSRGGWPHLICGSRSGGLFDRRAYKVPVLFYQVYLNVIIVRFHVLPFSLTGCLGVKCNASVDDTRANHSAKNKSYTLSSVGEKTDQKLPSAQHERQRRLLSPPSNETIPPPTPEFFLWKPSTKAVANGERRTGKNTKTVNARREKENKV